MRYPEPGMVSARLSLATSEPQGSSEQIVTEWHKVICTGQLGEIAERYIRKGTRLYVEGKLRTRQYEDKLKISRSVTEIVAQNIEILGRAQ